MAGGIGSRFWPLSTPSYPKQFIDILGCGRTLIQLTADRFRGLCPPANFWVVTNRDYVPEVRRQLPDIPASHILAEPAARNTAPCIALASWRIKAEDPDANVVVTPSDAAVMDPEEYRRVMRNALAFTESKDVIVTVGIRPSRPETGYGYVETAGAACGCSEAAESSDGLGAADTGGILRAREFKEKPCLERPTVPAATGPGEILRVKEFKEKPCKELAEKYLADGGFLWNAGIFVWNVRTIVSSLRTYCPSLASRMDLIEQTGDVDGLFPQCEKISIDYAVMEPASRDGRVFTHPADFGWSDLGNWASLYDRLPRDAEGNAAVGEVRFVECRDCLVHAEGAQKVILQGLEGYIVSERDGCLLVCRRSEEQRIRDFSTD